MPTATTLARFTGATSALFVLPGSGLVTMETSARKNIYTLCCDTVAEPIAALGCLVDPVDMPHLEEPRR